MNFSGVDVFIICLIGKMPILLFIGALHSLLIAFGCTNKEQFQMNLKLFAVVFSIMFVCALLVSLLETVFIDSILRHCPWLFAHYVNTCIALIPPV